MAAVAGCGGGGNDASSGDRSIATALITGGDQQTAVVATALPVSLDVKLLDSSGQPVPNKVVNFVISVGDGSVFGGAETSDGNGVAREHWTLGKTAGVQKVEVRATGPTGEAVVYATFSATAIAGAVQSLTIQSGDAQTARQTEALAAPLAVLAKDAYGNPAPGISVAFSATDGSVAPATTVTNNAGTASAAWTLGRLIGDQTVTAVAAGVAAVNFRATTLQAAATAPTTLTLVSGSGQTVSQHAQLAQPIVVKVTDALGNAVPGTAVSFSAETGSAYVTPATLTTDADGLANWQGYVHAGGTEQLRLAIAGIPAVNATVTVTPNSSNYDGFYRCLLTGSTNSSFTLTVRPDMAYVDPYQTIVLSSNVQSDGSVTAFMPITMMMYRAELTGVITIDSNQVATGAGSFVEYRYGVADGESGTWTCTRQ